MPFTSHERPVGKVAPTGRDIFCWGLTNRAWKLNPISCLPCRLGAPTLILSGSERGHSCLIHLRCDCQWEMLAMRRYAVRWPGTLSCPLYSALMKSIMTFLLNHRTDECVLTQPKCVECKVPKLRFTALSFNLHYWPVELMIETDSLKVQKKILVLYHLIDHHKMFLGNSMESLTEITCQAFLLCERLN